MHENVKRVFPYCLCNAAVVFTLYYDVNDQQDTMH
jgi:hypothetical protein